MPIVMTEQEIKKLEELAKQGDIEAQKKMGYCYLFGEGVTKNNSKAIEWFTKAAEQGDSEAQVRLGDFYNDTTIVETNYQKTVELYKKAAEQGNINAKFNLFKMFRYACDGEQWYEEVVDWCTKEAEQEIYAQNELGDMYYKGDGVEKNYQKAFDLYTKAAKQGNPRAQFNLALMYLRGEGTKKDYMKGFELCREVAEKGHPDAQLFLGIFYNHKQEYQKAFKWFSDAAEKGRETAQFALGEMYYEGKGVEEDHQKAIEWYKKAAKKGSAKAKEKLEELKEEFKEEETVSSESPTTEKDLNIVEKENEPEKQKGLDVFISHKSEDFEKAKDVYEFLTAKGLSVFLSEISLPSLSNSEYSDEIDNALEQAKNIVVIATSREKVTSGWVKSEWQTFANEKRSGRKSGNIITLLDSTMKIDDLPIRLRQYQVVPLKEFQSSLSFLSV